MDDEIKYPAASYGMALFAMQMQNRADEAEALEYWTNQAHDYIDRRAAYYQARLASRDPR